MTEILDLTKSIANTKEQIRKAINNHNVECGESIPFSEYPTKITQIKRDKPILAKNYLAHNPVKGEKIFVQKIEQEGKKTLELYSDTQIQRYGFTYMLQDVNSVFMTKTGPSLIEVRSWSSDSGFNLIYSHNTDYDINDSLSNRRPIIIYSSDLLVRINAEGNNTSLSDPIQFISSKGIVLGEKGYFYMPDGIAYKKDSREFYKYNPITAKIEDKLGISEDGISVYSGTCCSKDGKYIISSYSQKVNVGKDGVYKSYAPNTLKAILSSSGVNNFIGITADNKYLLLFKFNEANDGLSSIHIITTDNGFETDTYKEVPGLVLQGVPTWYPDKQVLCVNKEGTIKIYKYENGSFNEISMDFGDLTFSAPQQITLNKDFTKIFINDCFGNSGRSYLFDLKVTDKGYKAIPANIFNYSDKTLIGYCTGNNPEGMVEVQTLLPENLDTNPVA